MQLEMVLEVLLHLNFLSQPGCWHTKGRSFECVRSWRASNARSTKPLPQPSIWQTHGFSPVWIR